MEAAVDNAVSIHYLNSPAHARSVLRQMQGAIRALLVDPQDDPLLYAYTLRDSLPPIAAWLIDVQKWTDRVLDADSPDLPSTGASLCRTS